MTTPTVVRPRKATSQSTTAKRKPSPKSVNPLSGKALRQVIPTGTVAEVEDTIRRIGLPSGCAKGPMNGPDVPRKAVDELAPDPVCTTIEPRIDDTDVRRVIDLIDRSGLVEWAEERQQAGKVKEGRPALFGFRVLFVAMMLAARTGGVMHGSAWRRIVHHRVSPAMRAELGVPEFVTPADLDAELSGDHRIDHDLEAAFRFFDGAENTLRVQLNRSAMCIDDASLLAVIAPIGHGIERRGEAFICQLIKKEAIFTDEFERIVFCWVMRGTHHEATRQFLRLNIRLDRRRWHETQVMHFAAKQCQHARRYVNECRAGGACVAPP